MRLETKHYSLIFFTLKAVQTIPKKDHDKIDILSAFQQINSAPMNDTLLTHMLLVDSFDTHSQLQLKLSDIVVCHSNLTYILAAKSNKNLPSKINI